MNITAFLSFVLVSTFTPGINNLISATSGTKLGYKKTLRFMFGVSIGFLTAMTLSTFFIEFIYTRFPNFENILKYFGFVYILYLAFKILKSKPLEQKNSIKQYSLLQGILIQFINPKTIIFSITLISSFISPHITNTFTLILINIFLTVIVFTANTTWALVGTIFSKYLHKPKLNLTFNIIMASLLVYSAFSIL